MSAEIELAAQLESIQKTAEAWPSISILKQKAGTLRVQFDNSVSEQIEALVTQAYERSMETCELCGAAAQLDRKRGLGKWTETLCESCRKVHHSPPHRPQDKTKLPVWVRERDNKLK